MLYCKYGSQIKCLPVASTLRLCQFYLERMRGQRKVSEETVCRSDIFIHLQSPFLKRKLPFQMSKFQATKVLGSEIVFFILFQYSGFI